MSTYKTSNFYLSTFLEASEIPLVSHQRHDGKTTFEFAQTDGLSHIWYLAYHSQKLLRQTSEYAVVAG